MDTSATAQVWQMALRQFTDIQSPFGRAKVVVTVMLLLSALLMGMVRAHRAGGLTVAEAWVGNGLAIIIGLNTIDALSSTLGQVLAAITGRQFGGNGPVDLVMGVITLLACLAVWGLSGLGIMALARAAGRWIGRRIGTGQATG